MIAGQPLACFQPFIDTATGRIAGVEALGRLRQSDGQLLSVGPLFSDPKTPATALRQLDREIRGDTLDPYGEYVSRYCVDQAFLRGYDRKRYLPSGKVDDRVFPLENWIGYKLSPGANWKGTIGRFRLTVDKGYPHRLVSLCMDGIRKVSPTRFEVVKKNYTPTSDLQILILEPIRVE